jgi:hypothetical protein
VQSALLQLLFDRGARVDAEDVSACLANGRPEAAAFLAANGAPLDVRAARGPRPPRPRARAVDLRLPLGVPVRRNDVVEFFLARNMDLAAVDRQGQTALHHAVIGGQLTAMKLLMDRGAPLDAVNVYGGTVLGQARWSAENGGGDPDVYAAIIEALLAAGATE